MFNIFVNITSWTRVGSVGATHFYAKYHEFKSQENIFVLAREGWPEGETVELTKVLTEEEALKLNKKDRTDDLYKKGDKSDRFDSIDEIKARVKKLFPKANIAFFNDRELLSEESDIYEAKPQTDYKKTGKQIRIQGFEGFSKEFVNLTEDSIHDVIETPEKYQGKELQEGVWVWGITEPVLVLHGEFEYVN